MTQEEFLQRPIEHISQVGADSVPPEWLRAAWDDPDFRGEALHNLCRSVSKVGTLDLASDWLRVLSRGLPMDQAIELYESIRDGTKRCESEWRKQFEEAFPVAAPHLPPIDRNRELRNRTLALLIAVFAEHLPSIKGAVIDLIKGGFTLDEASMPANDFSAYPRGQACLEAIRRARGGLAPGTISAAELPLLLGKPHLLDHMRQIASRTS